MERLSDLPPNDSTQMSPQESDVMQKYFSDSGTPKKTNSPAKMGWMDIIKLSFYVAVLFALLANPWTDSIMCILPYCGDSSLILLAVKTILFMILFVMMYKFLV